MYSQCSEPISPSELDRVNRVYSKCQGAIGQVLDISRAEERQLFELQQLKPVHRSLFFQIFQSAEVLDNAGVQLTRNDVERTLTRGKSLLVLLREGGDGRELALKLLQLIRISQQDRQQLAAMVANRPKSEMDSDQHTPPMLWEDYPSK